MQCLRNVSVKAVRKSRKWLRKATTGGDRKVKCTTTMSEDLRQAFHTSSVGSIEFELFVPELVGTSEILTVDHRKKLYRYLPPRIEGNECTLVFSTSQHGFSLNSMYRKMTQTGRLDSPILVVIQDTDDNIFGALVPSALRVSDHFYGTGESLLYRLTPDFQVYNWTGENMNFVMGNNDNLVFGAGDGKFGLTLDGDIFHGRSQPCSTYANDTLTPQEDFIIKTMECWAFF